MKGKILVVAADFPYPPNHGGRVDVWKRMLVLKELGYRLDLLVSVKDMPSQEEIDQVEQVAESVIIVPRGKARQGLFHIKPHQVMNRRELAKARLKEEYDIALLEGSPCEIVLKNPSLKARNIVLRIHNNESLYFKKLGLSTKNPAKALYYFTESAKFALSERLLYKKIDHLLFISRDEYLSFAASPENKNKHAIFLPPAITPPQEEKTGKLSGSERVLFIGSLFMPNNRDGIEWYVRNVHPKLRHRKNYKFVVAGNAKGTSVSWLTQGPYADEIEFHDSPPDLAPLYETADVFVNPMRFGAGMKIKTIEALCQKLPMVSTTTGTEGTGLQDEKHLFCTDDAALFAKRIEQILDDKEKAKKMVEDAIVYIGDEFNAAKKLSLFFSDMDESA